MKILFIVWLIALLLMTAHYWLKKAAQKERVFYPKPVLTQNEVDFFLLLKRALPNHVVFAQVSMGALLDAKPRDKKMHLRYRNRFAQKIIDFVILDANLNVIALIELDDKTHIKEKDAQRDSMTREAGYTTIRYLSSRRPTAPQILKDVTSVKHLK